MIGLQTAAVTRLGTAGVQRVYSIGGVPASPAMPYAVISTTDTPGNYSKAGQHGTRDQRVNVQCFGSTFNECARTAERADTAFLDVVLTEFDPAASPCRRDIGTVPDRDPDVGGVIYALMSYTFTSGSN